MTTDIFYIFSLVLKLGLTNSRKSEEKKFEAFSLYPDILESDQRM
jgi:hypothetical protein